MSRNVLDNLILHPGVGTLATLDASQQFPVSAITIDPLVPNFTAVQIVCPTGLMQTREYAIGVAWLLRFFIPQ
jgi:hypothetical protein